jgi:trimethylamine--corrinoid protein Co-methyltransferase
MVPEAKAMYKVLSEDECHRVHEESISILEKVGVRVETPIGRKVLKSAGAIVDDTNKLVRFPKALVESSMKLITRDFTLSARKPGADLVFKDGILNGGESILLPDGVATTVLDRKTGKRRKGTFEDWIAATRLADVLDEIGMYWRIVEINDKCHDIGDYVDYVCEVFRNFSKHVNDGPSSIDKNPWFLEVIQTIFGTKEEISRNHPVSQVICPQSPLMIDQNYTETYLALKGWNIPVHIMPMPLMGATAPGTIISTVVQGNCEVLAMICLLQANEPGVPIIYAPALAIINPKTGLLSDGSIEYSIMSVAVTQMARYYGLPAESSPGGTDSHVLDFQNGYENAVMKLVSHLAWPDIIVGPGMLDGSMVSSLEQMYVDVEIFRLARKAHHGIDTSSEKWLMEIIEKVGPGGNYLGELSTLEAMLKGEWYLSDIGSHTSFENWVAGGKKDVLSQIREKVDQILETYEPLPLGEDVEKELDKICKRASENN